MSERPKVEPLSDHQFSYLLGELRRNDPSAQSDLTWGAVARLLARVAPHVLAGDGRKDDGDG